MGKTYYQGKYVPSNPSKYRGDPSNIIYRSSWERKAMRYLDMKESVESWGSEELSVPYISPEDGKTHRYFPDLVAKVKLPDGTHQCFMFEIKPMRQCVEPTKPSKPGRRYAMEMRKWAVNLAKWKAAKEFCDSHGWKFVVLTEKELNIR